MLESKESQKGCKKEFWNKNFRTGENQRNPLKMYLSASVWLKTTTLWERAGLRNFLYFATFCLHCFPPCISCDFGGVASNKGILKWTPFSMKVRHQRTFKAKYPFLSNTCWAMHNVHDVHNADFIDMVFWKGHIPFDTPQALGSHHLNLTRAAGFGGDLTLWTVRRGKWFKIRKNVPSQNPVALEEIQQKI